MAVGIGLVYATYRIIRGTEVNTAEAITSVEFDPVKEFDVIVEKGTTEQKLLLLRELTASPKRGLELPILADLYKKITAASTELLKESNLNEENRRYAAESNLQAYWRIYLLNIQNNVNDPFINKQFRTSIEKFSASDDLQIAKAAQVKKLRFLAGETLTRRNNFVDEISELVKNSLQKFPNDRDIIQTVRMLHSELIAVDRDSAAAIARAVTENQQGNDSEEFNLLVQHLSDLATLFELGIGNLPSITDITTTADDFYQRIETLARKPDVGETVYFQLSNAINYLEKNRNYARAIELGKVIADTAQSNPSREMGMRGKKMGDECVTRNSLIDSLWQFEEKDFRDKPLSNESFQGSVTLIAMYADNVNTTPAFLKMITSLERAFQGKNLQIVYVAVTDADNVQPYNPALGPQSYLLKSSKLNPSQFLLQCPTDQLPYFILVDKEFKVQSINVPTKELKTRIESLL